MRIGILTYHCVTNFGAQLQTLSTIGYMQKCGYTSIVLNWFPQDLEDFYLRECPRSQFDEQYNFAMNNMPVSKLCRTLDELCGEIDRLKLDAIFLGSDALFDYIPKKTRFRRNIKNLEFHIPFDVTSNHKLPNPFWGSFIDLISHKIPFCGFSISSQNMPYFKLSKDENQELYRLLNKFSLISTRDEWTKRLVETVGRRNDVFVTPDPVFGFNNNTAFEISKESLLEKYSLPENYVLISFYKGILSDGYVNKVVHLIEKETGADCVSFPMPGRLRRFDTRYVIDLPLPTLDWYYLIKYSRGYIGELMHPIVVSLHNSVPFFCFDQYGITRTIIPKFWHKYIKSSSKIFDILHRADFLDNWCPYADCNRITPNVVVKSFLMFDKNKCAQFSERQFAQYSTGMEKMLKSLI